MKRRARLKKEHCTMPWPVMAAYRKWLSENIQTTALPNNFGALRILAVLMVIYGHGKDLKGEIPPIFWNLQLPRVGLDIFFCISGYLIYDSWLRSPDIISFIAKRFLRIFPGLAVCVLASVFILGPCATTLPLHDYFGHHGTWQYLLNIALYLKLYLPGVFTHRALGGAINGSLWSLFPEVLCYLAVPLIWQCPKVTRPGALLAAMLVCGFGGLYLFAHYPTGGILLYSADPKYVLVQVPFFMAGAFWRHAQLAMGQILRLDIALIFCALDFILPPLIGLNSIPFSWLTLSYAVIAFGCASTPVLRMATLFGDLSYGAYLYAFPVQQLVLDHFHGFAITIGTVVTFGCAFVSWHLIERPALRLKPGGTIRPDRAVGRPATAAPSA